MGTYPDLYIPTDAFDVVNNEVIDLNDEINQINNNEIINNNQIGGNGGEILSDAMTDEEFARYLASTMD
eukprot:CAMPEP_0174822070 /NCGR_PEP_ID=MMETSP1107-20130205/12978_1 /TAXON_ID=36770 /ORGANISM="Paraphysomonas vestita, Strain GFlagA" /LENGTH=68 /DNA_ID=CAMNT_0016040043 /DNA_START=416 /DNA_END=622 /DNA_ORIENTATION=-